MDSSIIDTWNAAEGNPFVPVIGKDNQFAIGFLLVLVGLSILGLFTLSMFPSSRMQMRIWVNGSSRPVNRQRSLAGRTGFFSIEVSP